MLYKTVFLYYNKFQQVKEERFILKFEFIVSFRGIELRFAAFSLYDIINSNKLKRKGLF